MNLLDVKQVSGDQPELIVGHLPQLASYGKVRHMTEPHRPDRREPDSFWHRRRPGLRYIYSVAAIAGGLVLLIRYANEQDGSSEGSWLLVTGVGLLALGAVSIPIYAWMDKRKL
jgi:hypothetical protein